VLCGKGMRLGCRCEEWARARQRGHDSMLPPGVPDLQPRARKSNDRWYFGVPRNNDAMAMNNGPEVKKQTSREVCR